ncbi:hypothetical protein H0H93_007675 [Arthromyces matolae]|nr:hypothetical protein H0H93_007675 [Arthromyces matolae]
MGPGDYDYHHDGTWDADKVRAFTVMGIVSSSESYQKKKEQKKKRKKRGLTNVKKDA